MNKIRVYHFHNGSGGGVFSVIKNLLQYSATPGLENHVIYTINKDAGAVYQINNLKGAASETIFYYSSKWNFNYTCKKLSRLLPDDKAVLVTHDWIELGMISHLGLQNPVVMFLHGDFDYYYNLAHVHKNGINKFVCISPAIYDKLIEQMKERANDIIDKKFPVPAIPFSSKENTIVHCIYYTRDLLEERKQFNIIPLINKALLDKQVTVSWTIAGGGLSMEGFNDIWGTENNLNVNFQGFLGSEAIAKELALNDLFLLPSLMEGLPVALVEAMKAGVVPLITDWDGATAELVIDGKTGYYCEVKNAADFTERIIQLNADRKLLKKMSKDASDTAIKLFDPVINTLEIEKVFIQVHENNSQKKMPVRVYGSRLDHPWIANAITSTVRKTLKK